MRQRAWLDKRMVASSLATNVCSMEVSLVDANALLAQMAEYLTQELGDGRTARTLAKTLLQETLSWRPPTIAAERIETIIAFTFGNRMFDNGNREPGPVNEALADVVVKLYEQGGAHVYAQWEVAAALTGRVPEGALTPVYPGRDDRGEPLYLSTPALVAEIARRVGDPAVLGVVGVVGLADHLWRCVATTRQFGFDAHAPAIPMPNTYDPLSGQAWCRNRDAYLLHDVMLRVTARRAAVIARTQDGQEET